jgi:hypothetical protein
VSKKSSEMIIFYNPILLCGKRWVNSNFIEGKKKMFGGLETGLKSVVVFA